MLNAIRVLKKLVSHRDNAFDNAEPGAARLMTGLFHRLAEKQKQKVLAYKGPEYAGGPKRKTVS